MMKLTIYQALKKGVEAHKAGKLQEADRHYTAILKVKPKHPDANHNMGVLAVDVGKIQEALPFFKTALETNPNNAEFWLSCIDALIKLNLGADAKAVFDEAKSKCIKGDGFEQIEKRLIGLEKGIEVKVASSNSQEPPKEQLQNLIYLYTQGQFQKALAQGLELLKDFPNSINLYDIIGAANIGLGKLNEAIEAYKKALSIKPDYAEAHYNIALILHDQRKLDEAIKAYNKVLTINPSHGSAKHLVSALTGKTHSTAPKEFVENLFDEYAGKFEVSLIKNLEYKTPKLIKDILINSNSNESLGSVLDLGCGTGLFGLEIKSHCSKLEGIDLSNKMLGIARDKNVYDNLTHSDIVEYLSSSTTLNFDYFVALDVFIYVGSLVEIFSLIKSRNKKPGRLVFSTEHTEVRGYTILKTGRYAHSKHYIDSLCKKFDYQISNFATTDLRKEQGKFLKGGIYILDF